MFDIIENGNAEALVNLLEADAEPNICNGVGETPLHKAARRNVQMVTALLHAGANPNAVDDYGSTPLREAILAANPAAAVVLVQCGASLEVRDKAGQTPLLLATNTSMRGAVDIVKALVDAGADVNAADKGGCTPIYNAVCSGDVDSFRILLEAGADPDKAGGNNKSARYIIMDNRSSAEMRTMAMYLPAKA